MQVDETRRESTTFTLCCFVYSLLNISHILVLFALFAHDIRTYLVLNRRSKIKLVLTVPSFFTKSGFAHSYDNDTERCRLAPEIALDERQHTRDTYGSVIWYIATDGVTGTTTAVEQSCCCC